MKRKVRRQYLQNYEDYLIGSKFNLLESVMTTVFFGNDRTFTIVSIICFILITRNSFKHSGIPLSLFEIHDVCVYIHWMWLTTYLIIFLWCKDNSSKVKISRSLCSADLRRSSSVTEIVKKRCVKKRWS